MTKNEITFALNSAAMAQVQGIEEMKVKGQTILSLVDMLENYKEPEKEDDNDND